MSEIKKPDENLPEVLDWEDEEDDLFAFSDDAWTCDSDEKAEWCMARIRSAQQTVKNWEAHYAKQMDGIRKREQRTIDWMSMQLRRYLLKRKESGLVKSTKTADSYALPGGTLKLKHGGWDYQRDADALLAWIQSEGMEDLVKVKLEPKWAELKKQTLTMANGDVVMKDSGEVVKGVRAVMKPDEFVIE